MSKKIGILGGGQLGRMLALAGYPLGLHFHFFDPATDAPVDELAPRIARDYIDTAGIHEFQQRVDVVTYEFENVPVSVAQAIAEHTPVFPPPIALETAQDRFFEKTFFQQLSIPTPPFAVVDSLVDLHTACDQIGLPGIVKTRRLGYDGKGQIRINTVDDIAKAWQTFGSTVDRPAQLVYEGHVDFDCEVSILAVRSTTGEIAYYPLIQNTHRDGILRLSLAPAPDTDSNLHALACEYARRVLDEMHYVGVLAIEFFKVGNTLIASEMAPRVHNSGHWTIEGSETSQFENHLRAILGLPLGSTAMRGHAAMINLIGTTPPRADILGIPNTHMHLYAKEARPGRKLGHITVRADEAAIVTERVRQIQALFTE